MSRSCQSARSHGLGSNRRATDQTLSSPNGSDCLAPRSCLNLRLGAWNFRSAFETEAACTSRKPRLQKCSHLHAKKMSRAWMVDGGQSWALLGCGVRVIWRDGFVSQTWSSAGGDLLNKLDMCTVWHGELAQAPAFCVLCSAQTPYRPSSGLTAAGRASSPLSLTTPEPLLAGDRLRGRVPND